jgi:hypothetical protein
MHVQVAVTDLGSLLSIEPSKQGYQNTTNFGAGWGEEI